MPDDMVSIGQAAFAILLGGVMEGSFALPMKLTRRWSWENTWMIYSVFGLVVIPWTVAQATVPHLLLVYTTVPGRVILVTGLFGLGWGTANVLFGLAVPRVGMATSFAVVVGMSAALGSLLPLFLTASGHLLERPGVVIMAGVLLTLLGVLLLGIAGRAREASLARHSSSQRPPRNMAIGMTLCILAGLLAPMLNFSFALGSDTTSRAIRMGASESQAVNAIWAIALAGGFLCNGGYCAFRLTRNRTWGHFFGRGVGSQYALASSMGMLWTGGILLYGWGASKMGSLGPAIGWPVFQGTMIVISSILGIASGEWRNAEAHSFHLNNLGLGILVVAIMVLSLGKRL